jgi:hypothetical protein
MSVVNRLRGRELAQELEARASLSPAGCMRDTSRPIDLLGPGVIEPEDARRVRRQVSQHLGDTSLSPRCAKLADM